MPKYLELSHRLSSDAPLPLGVPPVEIRQEYSIAKGDNSNLFVLHFSNHTGTHIDAPWHFVASGLRIGEFALEEFVFDKPLCLDIPLHDGELIEPEHLTPYAERISSCNLLMLRTGYTRVRAQDRQRYAMQSPGVSTRAAGYLVNTFPHIRALGLDTVSLASMQHLEDGLEAHRILLGGEGRRFLIIEDMNLDHDLARVTQVIALPLLIEGIDSAPCTVMGVIE